MYTEIYSFPLIDLKETDSTNRYLAQLCNQEQVAEYTIVRADYQTAGKGQRGNTWESERGRNLMFSFVLYPTFLKASRQFLLSQLTALAVQETLDSWTEDIRIKWPNDIYWKEKKICGMLIENELSANGIARSIVGIGLNINQDDFRSDAPNPISLKQITGQEHDRTEILNGIMTRMKHYYQELQGPDSGKIASDIAQAYHQALFRREGWHPYEDVSGRFMARLLGHFIRRQGAGQVNVLVATSGDTGSAVANGFLGVEGIRVYVLYPRGKVSEIQEKQFTTLGRNITAIEVDGTFDDCQALVKDAFMDADLQARLRLTSANSINVARFLPQAFYYFYAYAQWRRQTSQPAGAAPVVCVPSGNFGNITAGLFAARMGLPVRRFIAANNRNDVFYQYLRTALYQPRPSTPTIANAMDVGAPSNFARILDLYGDSHDAIAADISGATYTDQQIADTVRAVWQEHRYLLDPHGACGYRALSEGLRPGEEGIFLETAHPAKFKDTVERIVGQPVSIPAKLQAFMQGAKQSVEMSRDFASFKAYLMGQ